MHKARGMLLTAVFAFALLLSTGCATTTITFSVPIDTQLFSMNEPLQFRIWNARQLALSDRMARCIVRYTDELEEIQCPPGVDYVEVVPQTFSRALQEIDGVVIFSSEHIALGERYWLQIRGLNRDGCNTTSASIKNIAWQTYIRIGVLDWLTTEIGCL